MASRAVVLPGRAYPADLPVLALPVAVLEQHGVDVVAVSWDLGGVLPDDPDRFVTDRLEAAAADGCDLVVAKSLGTRAAACAAEHAWPAVWLTPLLTDPACVAGIRANRAPQLLVGGDADELWDVEVAASLADLAGCDVLEVPDADHGLRRAADPAHPALGADVERLLSDAVAAFLGRL